MSGYQKQLQNKVSFFDNEYSITGTRMFLSGFTPSRGITGSLIDVSGEGLGALRQRREAKVGKAGIHCFP